MTQVVAKGEQYPLMGELYNVDRANLSFTAFHGFDESGVAADACGQFLVWNTRSRPNQPELPAEQESSRPVPQEPMKERHQ